MKPSGGDSIQVVRPLFQEEGDGAIPISPLQLHFIKCPIRKALSLNMKWHSTLPNIINWQACFAYHAEYRNAYYAVAIWGPPIARLFNNCNYLELRRFAIANNAPRNTATRMMRVMAMLIKKDHPQIRRFISYQDTDVHSGTIYKAAGWKANGFRKGGLNAWSSNVRTRNLCQAIGDKIRWEYELCPAK